MAMDYVSICTTEDVSHQSSSSQYNNLQIIIYSTNHHVIVDRRRKQKVVTSFKKDHLSADLSMLILPCNAAGNAGILRSNRATTIKFVAVMVLLGPTILLLTNSDKRFNRL